MSIKIKYNEKKVYLIDYPTTTAKQEDHDGPISLT